MSFRAIRGNGIVFFVALTAVKTLSLWAIYDLYMLAASILTLRRKPDHLTISRLDGFRLRPYGAHDNIMINCFHHDYPIPYGR